MNDNQPYQQYIDAGYFKVNEYTYTNSLGQIKTNKHLSLEKVNYI